LNVFFSIVQPFVCEYKSSSFPGHNCFCPFFLRVNRYVKERFVKYCVLIMLFFYCIAASSPVKRAISAAAGRNAPTPKSAAVSGPALLTLADRISVRIAVNFHAHCRLRGCAWKIESTRNDGQPGRNGSYDAPDSCTALDAGSAHTLI
jgi:hypothetical protein